MHENFNIHDSAGNVIGGFPFAALLPLLASAVGPILNKVMGNGAHSISVGKHHHKLRKTKEKKGAGMPLTESESYLVPHIHSIHGNGAMGFGKTQGGASYWQGHTQDTPVQYGENIYPQGGAIGFGSGAMGFGSGAMGFGAHGHGAVGFGKKKGKGKKGGFAVDQMHSNAYTGFLPGHAQAMFPVNVA
jgi:hypothetical protein